MLKPPAQPSPSSFLPAAAQFGRVCALSALCLALACGGGGGGGSQTQVPVISALDILTGPPGTEVTLGGQHFVGVGSVHMIGGANDLPVEILSTSPSSVRIRVPQAAAGQYSFRVAAQGGNSANSAQRFTVVLEAPAIQGWSSPSGMPGAEFTVKSIHFQHLESVTLTGGGGDHRAEVLAQTATEVRVRIPAAPAGSYGIRLVTAGGVSPEGPLRYQLHLAPVIRSLDPASGSIATRVRAAGENLEPVRDVYLVGEGMETRATLLGTTPGELEWRISADTPPGTYALRLEGPFGHIQPANLSFRVEAFGGGAPGSGPGPLAGRAAAERAVTARNGAYQASAGQAAAEQPAVAGAAAAPGEANRTTADQTARAAAARAAAERAAEPQRRRNGPRPNGLRRNRWIGHGPRPNGWRRNKRSGHGPSPNGRPPPGRWRRGRQRPGNKPKQRQPASA